MADENTESQPQAQTDTRPQGDNRPPRNDNRRPFKPRNNNTRPEESREEGAPREGQDNRPPRNDNRPPRTDNRPPRQDNRPARNDNQPPRTNHLIRNPAPSDSATDLSTESENNARPQRSGGSGRGGRRGSGSAPIDTNLRDFVLQNQEVHKNRLNPHLKLNLDNNEKVKI